MPSAADLPDDIDELKRRLIAAEAGLLAKTLEAEKLKFELARLKRMYFRPIVGTHRAPDRTAGAEARGDRDGSSERRHDRGLGA
jgi:hypothetical protein